MFFTKEDFRKIEEYLKLNSKKDSDFAEVQLVTDNDKVVILQNNDNKSINIGTLLDKGIRPNSIDLSKLSTEVLDKLAQLVIISQAVDIIQNKLNSIIEIPHVVLNQQQYDSLEHKNENTLYLIVDKPSIWKFGDTFPITLAGDWRFEEQFPVRLI